MAVLMRFLRQPLVHFLLIGAAIFAAFSAINDAPSAPAADMIVVTQDKADQLAASFEAVWRRPPTDDERSALIEDHIREEVFVREAVALSLDRDDTVIRRRLRQKMEFLTISAAEALQPSEDDLRFHYQENADRFSADARIGFVQVYLGEQPSAAEIEAARIALAGGADPAEVGERTLLPQELLLSPEQAIDGTFGRGFFAALADAEPGGWHGPVRSGFGLHWVKLTEREAARTLPFDAVRDLVESDWRRVKSVELAEAQYQALLARYQVTRPDKSTGAADTQ